MILYVSLIINIVVLVPVIFSLVAQLPWTVRAFGVMTPARNILLSTYLTFLVTSILFLLWPLEPGIITLLAIQISYKILSAFTVRTLTNPVVIANLIIAMLHTGVLVLHNMS
jgi:hypothetical protein